MPTMVRRAVVSPSLAPTNVLLPSDLSQWATRRSLAEEALHVGSGLNSLKGQGPQDCVGRLQERHGGLPPAPMPQPAETGHHRNYYKDVRGDVGDASGKAPHSHLGETPCIICRFGRLIAIRMADHASRRCT